MKDVRKRFFDAVKGHKLTIIKDDGLYRHIRLKTPGDMAYYFEIITWPGFLTITGDMGTYAFSRTEDMFHFFGSDIKRINPCYWGEKLKAQNCHGVGTEGIKRFCKKALTETMRHYFEQKLMDSDLTNKEKSRLWRLVQSEIINPADSEREAHELIEAFGEEHEIEFYDLWEANMTDYSFHYIWILYAIVWGISQYQGAKSESEAA